ncbi:aldo/keto reductase [Salinicoccus sp. ID82-1]|uniref:Aldo/keto reductase n=1 Tax=Salinicoccus cyprini TaxID=2493691 RepID=A0A558AU02_9STAP|nr:MULTISPECIES: aldo/keto reductase [Salinicoccus]MCG1010785.1 aldo/keto reductase [Salinicoccus sp. ID82-1]TVT27733.1 aldo/keto reductase [Salinicoccus cyprini]
MQKLTDTFTLTNGVEIPCVGFGTWQTPDGETAVNSVKKAIESGYRHIDTAAAYKNEGSVGKAIKESGVAREDLFITSKLWNSERGYDKTKAAFEQTLKELDTDYLDLYLIHWPANQKQFDNWEEINNETWKAMTELYEAGKVKAIGVSNFMTNHLEPLLETEVKPMVNQIEYHPGHTQNGVVDLCKQYDILVEAWSPIGSGRLLEDESLKEIAQKYDKSVAQLCIRYVLQNGALPLPKSVTPERIEENTHVFDFEISDEDMKQMDAMENVGFSGMNPNEVDF